MNLCTDQLAMLVAAEGQLHSVSYLALDERSSAMAREAETLEVNHGLAEEIFLMQPDLVIAGTYSTRAAVSMLRRLGFRVEEFDEATSFEEIRTNVRRMGELLGRSGEAERLVAEFDERLARVAMPEAARRPSAALYFSNSYTDGAGTLTAAIVEAAGLTNVATTLGLSGAVRLPLELLVMADPELVITGNSGSQAPAMANEAFRHPALRELQQRAGPSPVVDRDWRCGTPFVADAVERLADVRRRLTEGARP